MRGPIKSYPRAEQILNLLGYPHENFYHYELPQYIKTSGDNL